MAATRSEYVILNGLLYVDKLKYFGYKHLKNETLTQQWKCALYGKPKCNAMANTRYIPIDADRKDDQTRQEPWKYPALYNCMQPNSLQFRVKWKG